MRGFFRFSHTKKTQFLLFLVDHRINKTQYTVLESPARRAKTMKFKENVRNSKCFDPKNVKFFFGQQNIFRSKHVNGGVIISISLLYDNMK